MRCSLGAASTTARAGAKSIPSPPPSPSPRPPRPPLRPRRFPLLPPLRPRPPREAVPAAASPPRPDREREDLEAFSPFLAAAAVRGEGAAPRPPPSRSSRDAELAWRLLARFTAADFAGRAPALLADPRRREALRSALAVVSRSPRAANGWFPASGPSPSPSSGAPPAPPLPLVVAVLASSHELACRALRDYLDLFGLPYCPPSPRIAAAGRGGGGGVFVKVSASSLVALASAARGVDGGDGERGGTPPSPPSPSPSPSLLQPPRASPYAGKDRGVLLTLGDTQFGHLPLGLLDESRERPAPALE
jgi:hypothetical protein